MTIQEARCYKKAQIIEFVVDFSVDNCGTHIKFEKYDIFTYSWHYF